MANRFRNSFHWKTFFFPDSLQCCLESQWLSHQHERARYVVTRAPAFILSALPSPSLTLCFPLWSFSSQPLREGSEEMQTEKKGIALLQVSLVSVSLSLVSLAHPPAVWHVAPVTGMSWPCWRGVPTPSAELIDPLIKCRRTSFRKSLHMYTHTHACRSLQWRNYVDIVCF